jgi:hypothetical protein
MGKSYSGSGASLYDPFSVIVAGCCEGLEIRQAFSTRKNIHQTTEVKARVRNDMINLTESLVYQFTIYALVTTRV